MAALIEVEALRKTFRVAHHHRGALGALRNLVERRGRVVPAVDGITFRIERGEMVGCIGPNGAGKSTTIKMLTGILVPSSGRIEVAGLVPHRRRKTLARRIGVVFGQRTQLWWDLPLIESLELLRFIYRVPARAAPGQPGLLHGATRAGAVPGHAGTPAFARPADARRSHGGPVARS